ncbi:unnamed protein product [Urochloa decumbens]|uniref:Ubiquitin-like protease family profile domain-containing protein n=1 Tax=Urochloa decumbens TaxID=240449 RepID=A0ABC9AR05_9POAL
MARGQKQQARGPTLSKTVRRNRASPSRLFKLYKHLSDDQKKMIRDAKFGGLLDIACATIPSEFANWLMVDCFDAESSQLVFPGRGKILLIAQSVADILGLPDNRTIVNRVKENKEANDDFLRSWLMLAVSTFLCPPTSMGISPRCYPAQVDLSKVKDLNWCQFVVDQLKDASSKINKKNSVRGCIQLLAVLYADSLEVQKVQPPPTKPRIAVWTRKMLDIVIKEDTNRDGSYGKLERKLCQAVSNVFCGVTQVLTTFLHEVGAFGGENEDTADPSLRRSKRKRTSEHEEPELSSEDEAEDDDYEEPEFVNDDTTEESNSEDEGDEHNMDAQDANNMNTTADFGEGVGNDAHGTTPEGSHSHTPASNPQHEKTDDQDDVPVISRFGGRLKLPVATGTAFDAAKDKSGEGCSHKGSNAIPIDKSNSLDFTPPDFDIMKSIDEHEPTQPGEQRSTPQQGWPTPEQENHPGHQGLDPGSAFSLDQMDAELLQIIENDAIQRIQERKARSTQFERASTSDINDLQDAPEASTDVAATVVGTATTPASMRPEPASVNSSVTPAYQPAPRRRLRKAVVLQSPYVDFTADKSFRCSKEACDVYNAVVASQGSSTRSSQVMFPVLQMIQNKQLGMVGHYFLLVLNIRNNRFEVLDSMRSSKDENLLQCCNIIIARIKDLWRMHYPDSKVDIQNYSLADIGVPLQTNDRDCGYHMLMHAEHWDGFKIYNFQEKDIPSIRKLLTYKWLTDKENETDWKTKLGLP